MWAVKLDVTASWQPCGMNENAARRRQLGRQGEDLAATWYEKRGFEVVARNWSCRAGELDIVACKGSQGIARAMVNKMARSTIQIYLA